MQLSALLLSMCNIKLGGQVFVGLGNATCTMSVNALG